MTTLSGSSAGYKAVTTNGLIREDVMDKIWDISSVPLPFTDLVEKDTCDNSYAEWTTDKLDAPAAGGWIVDGADVTSDDTQHGARIGNQCGILSKRVKVSARAQSSDVIGQGDPLAYQVKMRQKELRRNVEANLLTNNASVADNGDTTAGEFAGLPNMLTQYATGSGATGGGFSAGVWAAVTRGARVALTEDLIRDALQDAYEDGADPSVLMGVPGMIRGLSEYMFTSSSRIATLTREAGGEGAATAIGSVNVLVSDFGQTITFTPNRLQPTAVDSGAAACSDVFLIDPAYHRITYKRGYQTEPLAKTGLADIRLMSVDLTQKVLNLESGRVLLDLNHTAAVTAS